MEETRLGIGRGDHQLGCGCRAFLAGAFLSPRNNMSLFKKHVFWLFCVKKLYILSVSSLPTAGPAVAFLTSWNFGWRTLAVFSLGSLVWDFWLRIFSLGLLARDLWLGIFGLGSLAWDLWLGIFSFGSSAWDLLLWIFSL